MPTYEYVCRSCRRGLEAVQGFDDPALNSRQVCGLSLKKGLRRGPQSSSRESGFYKTDSRSGSSNSENRQRGAGLRFDQARRH